MRWGKNHVHTTNDAVGYGNCTGYPGCGWQGEVQQQRKRQCRVQRSQAGLRACSNRWLWGMQGSVIALNGARGGGNRYVQDKMRRRGAEKWSGGGLQCTRVFPSGDVARGGVDKGGRKLCWRYAVNLGLW